ncbi:MAG: (2Fe-2S)-binding protein [Desulfobacterales bacterium]|nr:(2Fe-2S)-binding protein [Desulfobacterales bacterium]
MEVEEDEPLLWVLREHLNLTGTKFGCGIGLCGCCTVHVEGKTSRSCILPVGKVRGKTITTIEGIPEDHPVKKAWIHEQIPQCGYCQSGQMMQAAALLAEDPAPTEERIENVMNGNLCRCGTYETIKSGIRRAAGEGKQDETNS